MDQEILKKIEKNTTAKPSFQIVLKGVGSKLENEFKLKCKISKMKLTNIHIQTDTGST